MCPVSWNGSTPGIKNGIWIVSSAERRISPAPAISCLRMNSSSRTGRRCSSSLSETSSSVVDDDDNDEMMEMEMKMMEMGMTVMVMVV